MNFQRKLTKMNCFVQFLDPGSLRTSLSGLSRIWIWIRIQYQDIDKSKKFCKHFLSTVLKFNRWTLVFGYLTFQKCIHDYEGTCRTYSTKYRY
jgi:hypothetical protein